MEEKKCSVVADVGDPSDRKRIPWLRLLDPPLPLLLLLLLDCCSRGVTKASTRISEKEEEEELWKRTQNRDDRKRSCSANRCGCRNPLRRRPLPKATDAMASSSGEARAKDRGSDRERFVIVVFFFVVVAVVSPPERVTPRKRIMRMSSRLGSMKNAFFDFGFPLYRPTSRKSLLLVVVKFVLRVNFPKCGNCFFSKIDDEKREEIDRRAGRFISSSRVVVVVMG
mmetsp:Transcript_9194/g.22545  ORF Transcript_9194/g.22545 Transcript_9194/m.22545 type:complete len:225 (-) Transcript_9194:12-686(-)